MSPATPRTSATTPLPAELPALTAVRGFAALAVVMFHFADRAAPTLILHNPLIAHGDLGVDLFFVLSGFILAHVYRLQVLSGTLSFVDFLRNRLARVYPLHAVLTLVALVWALVLLAAGRLDGPAHLAQLGAVPGDVSGMLATLAAHLTLTQGWGITSGLALNTVSWSVSAEWFAYMLFPLLAGVLLKPARPWLMLMAALAALLLADQTSRTLFGRPLTELTYHLGILRILPEFLLGMAIAALFAHGALVRLCAGRCIMLIAATLLALAALILLDGPTVLAPVLFGVLIAVLAEWDRAQRQSGRIERALIFLGTISYAIYLVHPLTGKLVFQGLGRFAGIDPYAAPLWCVGSAVLASLIVATAATFAIEHPARRLIRDGLAGRATPHQRGKGIEPAAAAR